MDAAVDKMAAQLRLWRSKINRLDARTQRTGTRPRFEDLMYVDELKAQHAILQLKFEEFKAAETMERASLKSEMACAWEDLDAALKKPMPPAS